MANTALDDRAMASVAEQSCEKPAPDYRLDDQVGFILRKAQQRHLAIFAEQIGDLTPTQFAVLAKLHELGDTSQNKLGRCTAMDAATVKGVIDRLKKRALIFTRPDENDQRRLLVCLTEKGKNAYAHHVIAALKITQDTLLPLSEEEKAEFVRLLSKLA